MRATPRVLMNLLLRFKPLHTQMKARNTLRPTQPVREPVPRQQMNTRAQTQQHRSGTLTRAGADLGHRRQISHDHCPGPILFQPDSCIAEKLESQIARWLNTSHNSPIGNVWGAHWQQPRAGFSAET